MEIVKDTAETTYDFDAILNRFDPSFSSLTSKRDILKKQLSIEWLSTIYPMTPNFKETLLNNDEIDFYDLAYTLSPCSNALMLNLTCLAFNSSFLSPICLATDREHEKGMMKHFSPKNISSIAALYSMSKPYYEGQLTKKTYSADELYFQNPQVREDVDKITNDFLKNNYIFNLLINPHKNVVWNEKSKERYELNKDKTIESKWLKFNIFSIGIIFGIEDLVKLCLLDHEFDHRENNQFCLYLAILKANYLETHKDLLGDGRNIFELMMDHIDQFDLDACLSYWNI